MLNRVRFKNFKGIRDSGDIELKRLTVLVGANSSGKTSFIQALMLLKQTLDAEETGTALQLNGPYFELGSYQDLIYSGNIKNNLSYEIEIDSTFANNYLEDISGVKEETYEDSLTIKFEMRYISKSRLIRVEDFSVEHKNNAIINIKQPRRGEYVLSSDLIPGLDKYKKAVGSYKFLLFLDYSELKKEAGKAEIDVSVQPLIFLGGEIVSALELQFLQGPLREPARRFYALSGVTGVYGFPRGEKAQEILLQNLLKRRKGRPEPEVFNKTVYWLERFEMLSGLSHDIIRNVLFNLKGVDPYSKIPVSLSDIGFGASQILPIIINGYNLESASVFFVEQPEIHLHPKLQAEVADLLIDIASEDKKVVVETHSEPILRRLLTRIGEGESINKDDVSFYSFNRTPQGIKINEVVLNEKGEFEGWPDNFFEISFEESYKWAKARFKNDNHKEKPRPRD